MTTGERVMGAMLGLACGDALGAPAEFHSPEDVRRRWGTLTEMVGGGLWAPGEWTDDTGMALCVAEAIIEHPDDPVPWAGRRFLGWRRTAKDVGATIGAALSGFHGDRPQASRGTPQAREGKAAGNGSLMRTLPVALGYHDETVVLRESARLSAMTHRDPQSEACCAVCCLWVRALLAGQGLRAAWYSSLTRARALLPDPTPDTPGMTPLPTGAAVAGGIARAFWGPDVLPERGLAKFHQRARLEDAARRLADLRRVSEAV